MFDGCAVGRGQEFDAESVVERASTAIVSSETARHLVIDVVGRFRPQGLRYQPRTTSRKV